MTRNTLLLATLAAMFSIGCSTNNSSGAAVDLGVVEDAGADTGTTEDAGPVACEPGTVTCIDQSLVMLDLFETVSPAAITEEGTTEGEFSTLVDASGGGFNPTQSYVYARFTDTGLVKVDVDDEAAFTSTDWDIAFRRYVVRLNSGVAGPSCTEGARTAPGTTFDSLTDVPSDLAYHVEQYFTESCDYVPDGSGIGAPGTVLSSFWTYPGCVSMSGYVYVIALANGRHVKFQVLSYYPPEIQAMCEESGTVPMPSGAGAMRVRWAFLD